LKAPLRIKKKHKAEIEQRDDAHAPTLKQFKEETEAKRKERDMVEAEARNGRLNDNAEAAKEVEDKTFDSEAAPYKSPFAPDEADVADIDKKGPDHQIESVYRQDLTTPRPISQQKLPVKYCS
jgi:hypothetical protein